MPSISLKPSHKAVKVYYEEIEKLAQMGKLTEGNVKPHFATLLRACAKELKWNLVEEYAMKRSSNNIRVDGALLDEFTLPHGFWEAKDSSDVLTEEVKKKFARGYPRDNIIFQEPKRVILYQNGGLVGDYDITKPEELVSALEAFFGFEQAVIEDFNRAVEEFKLKIPELAKSLQNIIDEEQRFNKQYIEAFNKFTALCKESINPNISEAAVEEMLIQHLLTERLFRKVFGNPDFVKRNAIASEIEKVIEALMSRAYNRDEFLKKLDRFYKAIENAAEDIDDWSKKQAFMNTVYEKFFQGFSVKVADTHGIVYTPQPIVDFMVRSVQDILGREFGRSLSDDGVHILDPFVGTGNFILRVMREINRTALEKKYESELHCNEVMLLPYYIASMNIEHEFYEKTGHYKPFEGICFVDTFQLAEPAGAHLFSMTEKNTERVERQKKTPIFVIISNPPYNAGQVNENDNNKNRKYLIMDKRVAQTYAKDSKATLKNDLSDVYVKAIRYASDRVGDEGIVAVVTNNSFIDGIAFDGMRKNLEGDFDSIYVLDLGGNVRKNPKLSGTTNNVFGIQVGVSISLFVKKTSITPPHPQSFSRREKEEAKDPLPLGEGKVEGVLVSNNHAKIYYARLDEYWRKEQKYEFLNEKDQIGNIEWIEITPDKNHTWLTDNLSNDYELLLPLGTKINKQKAVCNGVIFINYGLGVLTNRDNWVYNFNPLFLLRNIKTITETFNYQSLQWKLLPQKPNKENLTEYNQFFLYDDKKISWSRDLKQKIERELIAKIDNNCIRNSDYRPFCKQFIYFDPIFSDVRGQNPKFFPTLESEIENRVICVKGIGMDKPFHALMVNCIPDLQFTPNGQTFPFYTYKEEANPLPKGEGATPVAGEGELHKKYVRKENITDWALGEFQKHYQSSCQSNPRPQGEGATPVAGEGVFLKKYVRKENITDWALEEFRKHYKCALSSNSSPRGGGEQPKYTTSSVQQPSPSGQPECDITSAQQPSPSGGRCHEVTEEGAFKHPNIHTNEGTVESLEQKMKLIQYGQSLRTRQTDVESKMWEILRAKRFMGLKFRRQHTVGKYILDFYCPERKLAIEIDGSGHAFEDKTIKDENRTKELEKEGIKVLRFWNNEVLNNIGAVVEAIWNEVEENAPSPLTPPPEGEDKKNLHPQGEGTRRAEEGAFGEITKWGIFYYVYGLLHHPGYRKEYEANLRRELPRVPFAPDFWAFSKAGKALAALHVDYEQAKEHPLKMVENPDAPMDWRVKKMKYNKDKTEIVYNDFLTLAGIPKEAQEYKLGNRSALDWIVDQYRVTTDERSGITNDPNRDDDPQYIVSLIKKIVTVSLETVRIVKEIEKLEYKEA